jgi:hypothetical protein
MLNSCILGVSNEQGKGGGYGPGRINTPFHGLASIAFLTTGQHTKAEWVCGTVSFGWSFWC